MESFGARLKKLRNEKGITQEKLARDLDIPESSIRRLEISDGVPRMDRLDQIAEYFNKSTDYLLGRETKNELHSEETEADRLFYEEYKSWDDNKKEKYRKMIELLEGK